MSLAWVDHLRDGRGLGSLFAVQAQLEAAAVIEYLRLAEDLRALLAPAELVDGCVNVACDEAVHSRAMEGLALSYGGILGQTCISQAPPRDLFATARDNAVQGCIRERYGALLIRHQARHATDHRVQAVLARMAADEARHGEFAVQLATYLDPRLTPGQRVSIRRAQVRALSSLSKATGPHLSVVTARILGYPSALERRRMLRTLAAPLLSTLSSTDEPGGHCLA